MKFGNVALYCKGWYEHRPGIKNMWMDMIHCINADGWSLSSKADVVAWCMHRLDDLRNDDNFLHKYQLDLTYFWKEVNDIIHRDEWYYHEGLNYNDAIILHYKNIISNLESKYFNEILVKPNNNVLPLHYGKAYYFDNSHPKSQFIFSEMHCDIMNHIEDYFSDYEDQDISLDEFEKTESWIYGKNWQNVMVIIGTDSLLDCEEVELTGKFLNNTNYQIYKDDDYLDLNIYNHTVNFDDNKTYVCRIKKEIEHWNWGDNVKYKLMAVLKEV